MSSSVLLHSCTILDYTTKNAQNAWNGSIHPEKLFFQKWKFFKILRKHSNPAQLEIFWIFEKFSSLKNNFFNELSNFKHFEPKICKIDCTFWRILALFVYWKITTIGLKDLEHLSNPGFRVWYQLSMLKTILIRIPSVFTLNSSIEILQG